MVHVDYSNLSQDYDRKRIDGKKGSYIAEIEKHCLISLIHQDKSNDILDVGCGTGRGVLALSEEGYKVIGLDYTMSMLNVCKKKNTDKKIKLIQGDAGVLPFPDNCLNIIVSLNFLHLFSVEEQARFVNEMARVLCPNGVMICKFNNYYRGLVAGRKTLKVNPTLHLNRIRDFKNIFNNSNLKIEKIRGTALPYTWRLFQYLPNFGKFINRLGYYWPLSLIAPSFMVKAIKK